MQAKSVEIMRNENALSKCSLWNCKKLRWAYSIPPSHVQLVLFLEYWNILRGDQNVSLYVDCFVGYRRCTNFDHWRQDCFSTSKNTELFKKTGGYFFRKEVDCWSLHVALKKQHIIRFAIKKVFFVKLVDTWGYKKKTFKSWVILWFWTL